MARLARWSVAGLMHHVWLVGHNGQVVFADAVDRTLFVQGLGEACRAHPVVVHARAFRPDSVHLLLRPATTTALGAAIQALGRRFVAGYNARHGRSGTPWNGRYRATALQPGGMSLQALLLVDGWAQPADMSLPARWSQPAGEGLTDPPELWALGNTPFEREQAYAERLHAGVAPGFEERLLAACRRGLPLGDGAFLAELEARHSRPARARPRGRPRSA
jgi:putative transposase